MKKKIIYHFSNNKEQNKFITIPKLKTNLLLFTLKVYSHSLDSIVTTCWTNLTIFSFFH